MLMNCWNRSAEKKVKGMLFFQTARIGKSK
jgi:hypothetical protein